MNPFLPSTQFFATLAIIVLGFAAILAGAGSYLQNEVGLQPTDTLQVLAKIIGLSMFSVIAVCAAPLLIRAFLLLTSRVGILPPSAPRDWRGLADRITVAVWLLWLTGGLVAVLAIFDMRR